MDMAPDSTVPAAKIPASSLALQILEKVPMHFRKFSPIKRKYPIFELIDGQKVLFDVSKNDSGIIEIAFGEAVTAVTFDLDQFNSLLQEGVALAQASIET
jgi:hypothetical protein